MLYVYENVIMKYIIQFMLMKNKNIKSLSGGQIRFKQE